MELTYNPPIVAIDFDETIATNGYPDIKNAKLLPYAKKGIEKIQEAGWRTVLWTCRENQYLIDAIEFLRENEIFLDAHNENILTNREYEELGYVDSRKIGADVYIDDRNINGDINWEKIAEKLINIYDINDKQMSLWESD